MHAGKVLFAIGLVTASLAGCLGSPGGGAPPLADASSDAAPAAPPAADIVLASISVDPQDASVDEEVTLTAEFRNDGNANGTVDVVPLWNGKQAGNAKAMSLAPGASGSVEFTFVVEEYGNHDAAIRFGEGGFRGATVHALGPMPRLTEWSIAGSDCADSVDVALAIENAGGAAAEGYVLEIYSKNSEGRWLGHSTIDVPTLEPDSSIDLVEPVFAPQACAEDAAYTLTFILTKDGVEEWRDESDPFRADV